MASKLYYYIGKGVYNFGGKDYGYGALLPSAVPDETIHAMLKKGKIADKAPKAESNVDELGALRDKVKVLVGERDAARAELGTVRDSLATAQTDLATVTGERDAARDSLTTAQTDLATVRADLDQANRVIAEMTEAQLGGAAPQVSAQAAPETPVLKSAAGPKK